MGLWQISAEEPKDLNAAVPLNGEHPELMMAPTQIAGRLGRSVAELAGAEGSLNNLVGSTEGIASSVASPNSNRRHLVLNAEQRRELVARVLQQKPSAI